MNAKLRNIAVCIAMSLLMALIVGSPRLGAQTASSAVVLGEVTDSTGAVIPNAEVMLTNLATNIATKQNTNAVGQYYFAAVPPGSYRLAVKMSGFRGFTLENVDVAVSKSYNLPVKMTVGQTTETVEVQAGAVAELQTTDAQLGNALELDQVSRLPTLTHDASEFLLLQPGVNYIGSSGNARVAGAIDDQNTTTLDGVDITSNVVAGVNYVVPLPVDSIEEFRVGLTNSNATYGRASGGQVALIGRHGTNTFHGAVYDYLQNDALNANNWENGFLGLKKSKVRDNRYGGRFGGPIFKDKTFFFANYQGRRFTSSVNRTRLVPTDSLRQGILTFADASGNTVGYNLKTSTLCNGGACDPRFLGISPSTQALFGLLPQGNDKTQGDGLNTIGFTAPFSVPQRQEYGVLRVDHEFTNKYRLNVSYTYSATNATSASAGQGELDIRNGNAVALTNAPATGLSTVANLTQEISPRLINVVRFGYSRYATLNNVLSPAGSAALLNLPGTGSSAGPIALQPAFGLLATPIDVDTQRARFQGSFEKDFQYTDNLTWIKGKHTIEAGGTLRYLPFLHARADKVVGSLSSLVATMTSGGVLNIPTADQPPLCGAVTTNCLKPADVATWNSLYAATLGLLNTVSILTVRDGSFKPLPFGTPLVNDSHVLAPDFYGQDTWRILPSLTVSFGLDYGWQSSPVEKLGRQSLLQDNTTGQLISAASYLNSKRQAALNGDVFNPQLSYAPVNSAHHPVFNTDYSGLAPRLGAAWNPSFGEHNFMGKVFGDKKTVLRGGFSIVYDRTNTVQSIIVPMLGVGFAQTISTTRPPCNISGGTAAGCNPASANVASSVFRVGVDGGIPVPAVPSVSNPIVPAAPLGELLSFVDDPNIKLGRSYNIDFTIQHELPGKMLLELGYIGHLGRNLPQAINLNAAPYFFKDKASGQTFAQAYDAVAAAALAGKPAAAQPWFENQLPGVGALFGTPSATATATMQSNFSNSFTGGDVGTLFLQMSLARSALGLPSYNNLQVLELFMRTSIGESNYHALVATLNKKTSHGLALQANYTYSKALDDALANQNNAGYYSTGFNPGVDYGPSSYDRRHNLNLNYVYDIPAGKGHRFSGGPFIDKIIGGWYASGIFSAFSGLPLQALEGGDVFGGGVVLAPNTAAIQTQPLSTGIHSGVKPTTGCGRANSNGLNLFADPNAACNAFRNVLLSSDQGTGFGHPLYGLGYWNLDQSLGKTTPIGEHINLRLSADFLNIFNHVNLNNPNLNLTSPNNFGVLSSQFVPANRTSGARWIVLGFRAEF